MGDGGRGLVNPRPPSPIPHPLLPANAEVAEEASVVGVDVVGAVLLVVEVDEEGGALDAEGVRLGRVGGAGPGEVEVAFAPGDLAEQVVPDRRGEVQGVSSD